ncbi:MAG: hypothetical protein AAB019_03540 [Planctomycetota bacterium]
MSKKKKIIISGISVITIIAVIAILTILFNKRNLDERSQLASWRALEIVIGIHYDSTGGKYPSSLSELVPKYLDSLPKGDWEYNPKTGEVRPGGGLFKTTNSSLPGLKKKVEKRDVSSIETVLLVVPPSSDNPYFTIEVFEDLGGIRMPVSGEVEVKINQESVDVLKLDRLGRTKFAPKELLDKFDEEDGLVFTILARVEDDLLSWESSLQKDDISGILKTAQEHRIIDIKNLILQNKLDEAKEKISAVLLGIEDPWEKAFTEATLSDLTKEPYRAIQLYGECAADESLSLGNYASLLKRAIELSKNLNPKPPLPSTVQDLMDKAYETTIASINREKRAGDAYDLWQEVIRLAPWWPEPYYAIGKFWDFADELGGRIELEEMKESIINMNLFLYASSPEDSRRPEALRLIRKFQKEIGRDNELDQEWFDGLEMGWLKIDADILRRKESIMYNGNGIMKILWTDKSVTSMKHELHRLWLGRMALADYDKAIGFDSDQPLYYSDRATLKHYFINDLAGAKYDYDKAIELTTDADMKETYKKRRDLIQVK